MGDGIEAGPIGIAMAGTVRSEAPITSDVANKIFFIEISAAIQWNQFGISSEVPSPVECEWPSVLPWPLRGLASRAHEKL